MNETNINVVEFPKPEMASGMEGVIICLPDENKDRFYSVAEVLPGCLVQICFGEMGFGGVPKNRYSHQWAAVLKEADDAYAAAFAGVPSEYVGITLERGWMTGPPAGTVFRFTNDQVCEIGDPESVGNEIRERFAQQEKMIEEHNESLGTPIPSDASDSFPFPDEDVPA